MKQKILYTHPSSLGSGQKKTEHFYIYFEIIHGTQKSAEQEICSTHLPLPPPPPTLLHQASQPPVNESPLVFEVPAICSHKPGDQHTGKRKKNTWTTVHQLQQNVNSVRNQNHIPITLAKSRNSPNYTWIQVDVYIMQRYMKISFKLHKMCSDMHIII